MGQVHSVQIRNGEAVETTPGSLNASMNPPAGTTNAQPSVRAMDSSEQRGRVVIRNGEATFESHGPMRATTGETNSTDPLDLGRDGTWGNRIPRHELKPDSIIRLNGIEGDVRGFQAMGLIEKGADGLYRLAESKTQEAPQQTQQEPMVKLSDGAEGFMKFASDRLGYSTIYAATVGLIERGDVKNVEDIASRLNKEPEAVKHNIGRLQDEFEAQAKSALGFNDDQFEEFRSWCWSNNETANATREAILSQVDRGDLRGLKALGAKFTASGAAYDDDSLLSAEVPEGARVWRNPDTRQIMVSYKGRTNTLRGLIASGEARVSKRK
jgi:hypothetical protein